MEASIENKTLKDKDGNRGQLAVGMEAEAKIVTQKKSIIRYLLEKIDLFWRIDKNKMWTIEKIYMAGILTPYH